ncbi:hypothetical protein ES705_37466 [subsurface metagenome]
MYTLRNLALQEVDCGDQMVFLFVLNLTIVIILRSVMMVMVAQLLPGFMDHIMNQREIFMPKE